jgi:xanthine dehydrogenase small subunit
MPRAWQLLTLLRMDATALPPTTTPAPPATPVTAPPLTLLRRGQPVTLHAVPPHRTLLQVLREDLRLSGTKEGCRSGDCGACTVVLEEPDGQGGTRTRAVNSCIHLAHAAQGRAVWTVEDLASPSGPLHPVQQALVDSHASQCGFCTPGFAMSLYALYRQRTDAAQASGQPHQPVTRDDALHALSGNLCRCTGYRPILDAAQAMLNLPRPDSLLKSELLTLSEKALEPDLSCNSAPASYQSPTTLAALLQARAAHPQAQLVAGCTDVGLWVTKGFQTPSRVLDLTRVAELTTVTEDAGHLVVGAAVRLTDAFAALVARWPALAGWAARFAGLPVRNAGTLGGNVANGSPIGDSMPVLLALGARVRLAHWDAEAPAPLQTRELPLEQLYTGYRQNVMTPTEVLTHIVLPLPNLPAVQPTPAPASGQWLRAYKVSKRYEDDISAVCLGLHLSLHQGVVQAVRIGVGGVAATPVRALQTEAALTGQPWTADTAAHAGTVLAAEFNPISDMRASAAYRREVLAGLMQRAWAESQSTAPLNLEHTDLAALTALTPLTTPGAAA